ncbi:HET domain containing protein, partial [Pyrenophora tritici-repentis]
LHDDQRTTPTPHFRTRATSRLDNILPSTTITRGKFGQHVECEISAWPIDDAPPYYAISYTWGDPTNETEITINGKLLVVRRNCEYVLQQAFTAKPNKYYWVDAICIAQTTQEKNHQVGIMGQIYSGANHVFACVGPHADDSEYLFQCADPRDRLYGVLNLMDWKDGQKPTPDYNKDNFEVELDALNVILELNPLESCWPEKLIEIFHVTLAVDSLQHVIAARSNLIPSLPASTRRTYAYRSSKFDYRGSLQIDNVEASPKKYGLWIHARGHYTTLTIGRKDNHSSDQL